MKIFTRLFTKNLTTIPLFWVDFNYKKFKKYGKKKSCSAHLHPYIKNDEYLIEQINEIIDYIRDNYWSFE